MPQTKSLQIDLASALEEWNQDYETTLALSPDSKEELIWWNTQMINWNGKTLLTMGPDLIIESDASTHGWGASHHASSTGGPWSPQEKECHIKCLELLAATLALTTFAKNKTAVSVLMKIDNTIAVAYVNNQEGTVSKELISLTRNLWMWCLKRNIHIQAQHLPGVLNQAADREFRSMRDRSDWSLDHSTFQKINRVYRPLEVDLFASRLTNQCQCYFSWRPYPFAEASNEFLQDWTIMKGFCQTPWNLISRVLTKTEAQEADAILVAPVWKTQPWYPLLLSLIVDWLPPQRRNIE
uniref:RNase H type-1 domain-containing protein n=1 Tax=Amphimedon queenslandica TaxID=400682 RepID=A0A1X7UYP2_AMPQE